MSETPIGFGPFKGPGVAGVYPIEASRLAIPNLALALEYFTSPRTGLQSAVVTATWDAPSVGEDLGTRTSNKVVEYWISDQQGEAPYSPERKTTIRSATMRGNALSTVMSFRVRARTGAGIYGPAATATVDTLLDTTPPPQPSKPSLAPSLSGVRARWNGFDAAGAEMPSDFQHVEVHSGLAADFVPFWRTLANTLSAAGGVTVPAQPGETVYVKFVAVDRVGNRSTVSETASGSVREVTLEDLNPQLRDSMVNGSGNRVYYLPAQPDPLVNTEHKIDDLWYDTIRGFRPHRWDGTQWVATLWGHQAIGSMTAGSILTGELKAGQRIIAGPANASHAEVSSRGFTAHTLDEDTGVPYVSATLGSAGRDYLGLYGPNGEVLAGIDDLGRASFTSMSVDHDIELAGDSLNDSLRKLPRGLQAWGLVEAPSVSTDAEVGWFEVYVDLETNRFYRITTNPIFVNGSASDTTGRLRLRFTLDNSTPTVTSPLFVQGGAVGASSGNAAMQATRYHRILGTSGVFIPHRFLLCIVRYQGTGTVFGHASFTDRAGLFIEDIGDGLLDETSALNTGGGSIVSGTASTPTSVKKKHVKTYTADWTRTYKGNGAVRSDTGDAVQGQNGLNGDMRALIGFPSWLADLSGATINKIEIYLYAKHWFFNSGGTAIIGTHSHDLITGSSVPTTGLARDRFRSPSWPKPGGRWLTVPTALHADFKSGAARGIMLGQAGSTNQLFYGRFAGSSAPTGKPLVRITYTK